MRENRIGRHEGPGGLKPPVTVDHHNRAIREPRVFGRHEHPIPVFISSFVPSDMVYVVNNVVQVTPGQIEVIGDLIQSPEFRQAAIVGVSEADIPAVNPERGGP